MNILKGFALKFPVYSEYVITSLYGSPRDYNAWGLKRQHEGIDIAPIPAGEPARVYAAVGGRVSGTGYDPEYMGHWVEVSGWHDRQRVITRYHHLSVSDLILGMGLETGDRIGNMGDSGYATGVHLHFMLQVWSGSAFIAIDPLPYFPIAVREAIRANG